ncbi:MAG: L-rhamnose mutarotase [Sphingobacterium sp.]|uniref:L-rhamnose mutarotase n=1 Tax=Sphingobacterium sp. JB170 TaxID=1434842 RepID=UPI00097EAD11|nr:L-rhamnose mutarotase [Sphingobacterium sp. JB170]SJN48280.1 L-fucose mutarotase, type 2 [Sphingobacterium sp. JB170]
MRRYALALDLVEDKEMIAEYDIHHQNIWTEIKHSIEESGVLVMDIYRFENRLFMIMEVNDDFSFERKELMDKESPIVQRWEKMMWKYQKAIPGARSGEKWVIMKQIFKL